MKGHTWTVTDQVTGESFQYKRYEHGNYYMKRTSDSSFKRVTRVELFKSLNKAHVRNNG